MAVAYSVTFLMHISLSRRMEFLDFSVRDLFSYLILEHLYFKNIFKIFKLYNKCPPLFSGVFYFFLGIHPFYINWDIVMLTLIIYIKITT